MRLEPSLSQHELAGLIGASRESVVRALGELRRRGLISTGRRQLVVRDVAGLAQLTLYKRPAPQIIARSGQGSFPVVVFDRDAPGHA